MSRPPYKGFYPEEQARRSIRNSLATKFFSNFLEKQTLVAQIFSSYLMSRKDMSLRNQAYANTIYSIAMYITAMPTHVNKGINLSLEMCHGMLLSMFR